MTEKVCVITGCSDGIGKETAIQMATLGTVSLCDGKTHTEFLPRKIE